MKGIGRILYYLFVVDSVIRALVIIGLILFAFSALLMLAGKPSALAFLPAALGFILSFAAPFISAPIHIRILISNKRLSLCPGFHVKAGLALLLMTVLCAGFFPLLALLSPTMEKAGKFGFQVFILLSLYIFIVEVSVASRIRALLFNLIPFTFVFLLWRYPAFFKGILSEALIVNALFTISLLGWSWYFLVLSRHNIFSPVRKLSPANDFMPSENQWYINSQSNISKSAGGSLLLGCPDALRGRLARAFAATVLSPLFSIFLLYLIGFHHLFKTAPYTVGGGFYLFLSLSIAGALGLSNGELAARGRLLWLKVGKRREDLWQFMERQIIINLLVVFAMAAAISLAGIALLPFADSIIYHYALGVICYTTFATYFALAAKTYQVKPWIIAIIGLGIWLLIMAAAYALYLDNHALAVTIEIVLLTAAFALRTICRHGYSSIDWHRVKITPMIRASNPT